MIGRFVVGACLVVLCVGTNVAHAQDVPGIEICTAEKAMERRTSCLQSNVEFLHKTIAKLGLEHQQKLDAANRQIEALRANVVALQKAVDELKAAQGKTPDTTKKPETSPLKDTTAKDATKDATPKATAKEDGK